MNYTFSFEKLDVWKLSRVLTRKIYSDSKSFPQDEKFGLVNQIRRASISVCSNIAEGSARTSYKDQARFYQIAYGSLMEVMNQLLLCVDLNYLEDTKIDAYREDISAISNKLNALRKSCLRKVGKS